MLIFLLTTYSFIISFSNMDKKISPTRIAYLPLSLTFMLATVCLQAQTSWTDTTGNHQWSDAGNWSNGLPVNGQEIAFSGTGGDVVLNANASFATSMLLFAGANQNYTFKSNDGTMRTLVSGSFRFGYGVSGVSLTLDGVSVDPRAASNMGYNGSDNTLTISGANSRLNVAYNTGFTIGSGNGTIAENSNNTVEVKDGGTFSAGQVVIGSRGANNQLIVRGTGSSLLLNSGTGQTNFNLNIGLHTAGADNSLSILDGATATNNNWNTQILNGKLVVGKGSELIHANTATREQNLIVGGRGALYGAGRIVASNIRQGTTGAGAEVYVGEGDTDFAVLEVVGNWQHENMTLYLQVGDVSAAAVAGVNYDYLSLEGVFTYGGAIVIDLAEAVLAEDGSVRLIGWESTAGNAEDMSVSFINGQALNYSLEADGLYVMPQIPEPATTVSLIAAGGALLAAGNLRRRRRCSARR